MKTCLVLEGGAMRGMYTAGALDVFYNAGIQFDGIIGVSAGAAFGVNYLSRQPGRVIRYNKRFNADHHYMGPVSYTHLRHFACFPFLGFPRTPFTRKGYAASVERQSR